MSTATDYILAKHADGTKFYIQHSTHPRLEVVLRLSGAADVYFELADGRRVNPYHLVNLYRKLHAINQPLQPLDVIHPVPSMPVISAAQRLAERTTLMRLTLGKSRPVAFAIPFPHHIYLDMDGTFTLVQSCSENPLQVIERHNNLHSLELLWHLQQSRGFSGKANPPDALSLLFFQDDGCSLEQRLATTLHVPHVAEASLLKDIVARPTLVRVPESNGRLEVYLMPEGTFRMRGAQWSSWDILHAFLKDAEARGTPDPICDDETSALEHIFLDTDLTHSLQWTVDHIYDDMPDLVEDESSASATEHVCDGDDNCDCKYCSPISLLFEKVGLLTHQMGRTQRRLDALEGNHVIGAPAQNQNIVLASANPDLKAILQQLQEKEARLRQEITAYQEIERQQEINRRLEGELAELKKRV